MKKKYILTIPEPCNESWNEMPLSGKGRDCSTCEKNIRDFSHFSDAELISLLKTEGQLCGRFDPMQLDRQLKDDSRRLLPTFNLYAVAAGLGVLISFPSFSADFSYSNNEIGLIELLNGANELPNAALQTNDSTISIKVVSGHQNSPMPDTKIQLLNIRGHVIEELVTDSEGTISFSRMMLEELQVREIIVVATDNTKEVRMPFTASNPEETTITLKYTSQTRYRTMGVVYRPRF